MAQPLTIREVGRLLNLRLPEPGKRTHCPIRSHKRDATHFAVWVANDGKQMFSCFACDPPTNLGDSVALYAVLKQIDRKAAWRELRAAGYAVPGGDQYGGPIDASRAGGVVKAYGDPVLGLEGRRPKKILDPNWVLLDEWQSLRAGSVERFAAERGISAELLRKLGVIDMPVPGGAIGFVYTSPDTGYPCRIKVRCLGAKKMWNEPRPDEDNPEAKSLGPLYLAHLLRVEASPSPPVIVEGEPDALALAYVGIPNVVSLADGAGSATHCDLSPLCPAFRAWLIATDDDEAGDRAFTVLSDRAHLVGIETARLYWRRLEGDDVVRYKDANDALRGLTLSGERSTPFGPEDFAGCIRLAAER